MKIELEHKAHYTEMPVRSDMKPFYLFPFHSLPFVIIFAFVKSESHWKLSTLTGFYVVSNILKQNRVGRDKQIKFWYLNLRVKSRWKIESLCRLSEINYVSSISELFKVVHYTLLTYFVRLRQRFLALNKSRNSEDYGNDVKNKQCCVANKSKQIFGSSQF